VRNLVGAERVWCLALLPPVVRFDRVSGQLDVYVESVPAFQRSADYLLQHMLRRAGLAHRVLDRFAAPTNGGRAVLHVDLTDVPARYRAIHTRYPGCINGRATTISRLLYSTARVGPDDTYRGPVIVKTVLNHHGWPETRLATQGTLGRRLWHQVRTRVDSRYVSRACPAYRVHPSIAAVPSGVWRDRRLMVEQFLAGRIEPPIEKYRFDFFYDVESNLRSTHASLLCDPDSVTAVEHVAHIPQEVREVRHRLHLDFGAIDYFMVHDAAVVIDANKTVGVTPSWIADFPVVARYIERATERLVAFAREGLA
jgi:hypothetical protein